MIATIYITTIAAQRMKISTFQAHSQGRISNFLIFPSAS